MSFRLRVGLVVFLMAVALGSSAQVVDTTVKLNDVPVMADYPLPAIEGERTQEIDPNAIEYISTPRLDQVMRRFSGIYVKSYGGGAIATISLRGGSAEQTAVTWHGLTINNTMLGLQDISLVPIQLMDDIQVGHGGSTAATGSGAIAGVVNLNNERLQEQGLTVSLTSAAGSFGSLRQTGALRFRSGRWAGNTKVFSSTAKNDFEYSTTSGERKTLEHAENSQVGVLQDVYYSTGGDGLLSAHLWWQYNDREIPPTTVQSRSEATQEDQSYRAILKWKQSFGNWKITTLASAFVDNIDFSNPPTRTNSFTSSTSATVRAFGDWSIDKSFRLRVGMSHNYIRAKADAYDGYETEDRTSAFVSFLRNKQRWSYEFQLRQTIVDGQFAPTAMSIGGTYNVNSSLGLRGKVSRDFRLPTMNARYWRPGGNPDLEAERGWSQELGVDYNKAILEGSAIHAGVTIYNRNINNWIIWSIVEGTSYWGAYNLAEVHSRGLEARLDWTTEYSNVKLNFNGGYDLVISTNEKAIDLPMIAEGEQLIYTPKHSALLNATIEWKGFSIRLDHNYTGEVETDLNSTLSGYLIGNCNINYTADLKDITLIPGFSVNNMWNNNYRVIQYRPMPGRNFEFVLKLNFNKNK